MKIAKGIKFINVNNICSGSSTTIQALGNPAGGTYSWTGPNSFSSTMQSPSISPTSNSIYTVSYSLNGCPTTDTVNVFIKPLPPIIITVNLYFFKHSIYAALLFLKAPKF